MRFLSVSFLFLVACGTHVSLTPLNASVPKAPRSAASVEVFFARQPVQAYTEVALLEAQGQNESKVFQTLRQAAADAGCDGLIVQPTREPGGVAVFGAHGFFGAQVYSRKGFRASCIMFEAS